MWSEPADGHRLVGPPVEAESAQAHERDEAPSQAGWAQSAEPRSRTEAREAQEAHQAHAPTPVDAAAQTWMQAPAEPYTRDRNEGRHRLEETADVEIPAPAVSPEQAGDGEDSQHPVRKAVSRLKTKVPDSVGEVVRKFRR
ncbi:hypothetical protein L3Q67_36170 [Saccharothrix sp. AJ9571]|nr:hypothetical protein L3Q67_36170 [Saccharothrix sp. AJ9571]